MSRIPSIAELAGLVIAKEAHPVAAHTSTDENRRVDSIKSTCRFNQIDVSIPSNRRVDLKEASCEIEITVVTVCFNPLASGRREVFLKNLDSVQAQEGVNLEHLIIDGASTDGTLEWLKTYHNTKHDIRILSLPDSGIYEAMNRGIALSRGKYVIFLNSDDYFHHPGGMAASKKRLEEFGCQFTFAPVRFYPPNTRRHPQLAPQRRLHRFLISWPFSHQTMLTLRSTLLQADGFDTEYRSAADYDLLLRMIVAGAKGCFVPLVFTTFSLGGYSADNKELAVTECIRILRNFYAVFYQERMTWEEVAYIIKHRIYPRWYINIYKQSQKLIRERFVGIPRDPMTWLSRWFNYIKYYLKCLNSSI